MLVMSKEVTAKRYEALEKTDYSESDLIGLAMSIARIWASKRKRDADNIDDYDHYRVLEEAFKAINDDVDVNRKKYMIVEE